VSQDARSCSIASRLDYCNSGFYQLSAAYLQAMQSMLNAGAHLIMRKWKYDHIISTLHDNLHWLPIRQQILDKLYTIAYKYIHGAAPSNPTNVCVPFLTDTKLCCFWSYYLEYFAIDPTCIGHYTWTVSEWTKDHTVSFGLRDMTRRIRDV